MSELPDLKQFIEYLAEPVLMVDQHSMIVFANSACSELTGYSSEQLPGQSIDILLEEKLKKSHSQLLQSYVASRSDPKRMLNRKILRCVKADGSLVPVRISLTTLMSNDNVYGLALIQDQTTVVKQLSLIETQAITDPLTVMYNRRYLDRLLVADNRWVAAHRSFGLLYMDLDGFKAINDQLGHDGGDVVLKTVAIRLKEIFRSDDLLLRVGGDEFLILVGLDDQAEGKNILTMLAQKAHESLQRPISMGDYSVSIDASIGAGLCPDDFEDIEFMIKLTDRAMYASKSNHKAVTFVADLLECED